ncbi:hypothetical protein [Oricola cellulosilytica]|uniref:Uncharacterized protein n=1 Tax=Oricola cellulosilytica TaxID=1429082 RepID=A0A4R0PAT8_9HYPH|nr:hypothetical protein [Oricola cellulosilytica]TCD14156.1 hypothetical protein E0D97_08680 [Oricola cellulosilytica]
MKKIIALAAALAFATPALAAQCPGDMAAIDAALGTASLTDEQMAEVNELRALGEEQHAAGSHADSVETLAKARAILGI